LLPRKTTCGAPTPIPTSNKYEVLNNGFTDDHASEIKRGVVETTAPSAMPPHAPHREVKIREVSLPQHNANNTSVTGTAKVDYNGGRRTHRLFLQPRQHNWSSSMYPKFKAFVDCDERTYEHKRSDPEALLSCFRKECTHIDCSKQNDIGRCFSDHVKTWPRSVQLELFREVFSQHHHPDDRFDRMRGTQ
jgi:hypothetical protein